MTKEWLQTRSLKMIGLVVAHGDTVQMLEANSFFDV